MAQKKDEGLNGNEKIEQAVCQLQQEPTQEQLAHTLTVIRRRMRENGQVVVAVEPNPASEQMQSSVNWQQEWQQNMITKMCRSSTSGTVYTWQEWICITDSVSMVLQHFTQRS